MKKNILLLKILMVSLIAFLFSGSVPVALIAPTVLVLIAVSVPMPEGALFENIDLSGITFEGELLKEIGEAVWEKFFNKPAIQSILQLYTGIKAKKKIGYLGRLGLVGVTKGDCEITPNPNGITSSEKEWDPTYVGDRFEMCWADLLNTIGIWATNNGLKKQDLTDTSYMNFWIDRLGDAMQETVLRKAYFDDKDINNVSGGGILVNGTDKKYFNSIDGLWKQCFAIGAANPAQVININRGGYSVKADQKFTKQDVIDQVVTTLFEDMLYNCDTRLSSNPDAGFFVTRSIINQYKRERKLATGIDLAYTRTEEGFKQLMFEAVPVVEMDFWDRTIQTYLTNGTKWNQPHRAILSTKFNLGIGTEEESNFKEIDIFYDKYTEKNVSKFAFNLDAKVLEDYLIMLGYTISFES